jgi:hypothetical protein
MTETDTLIPRQEEIAAYQMPDAPIGTKVVFFPSSDPHEEPVVGTILRAGEKAVTIRDIYAVTHNNARHLTDPRCKNPNTLDDGAWDYSPAYHAEKKEREDFLAAMNGNGKLNGKSPIDALTRRVELLTQIVTPIAHDGLLLMKEDQLIALLNVAGIKANRSWKLATLRKRLNDELLRDPTKE